MTHDLTTRRLSKVAREFNVGISTIVEFLGKKGHEVDSNPNTKISQECYDILLKEYSSDISIKKESEKILLRKMKERKENLSLDDVKYKKEDEDIETDDVILIKDVSGNTKKNQTSEVKKKEEKKEEKKESDIKIVGKIDLSTLNPKLNLEKNKEEEKIIDNIYVSNENLSKQEEHKPIEQTLVEKNEIKEVIEEEIEKTEVKHFTEESTQIITEEVKIEEQKNIEPEIIEINENITNEIEIIDDSVDFQETEEVEEPEDLSSEPVRKENEVKVVGKIDLDAINQRTRPAKKTKAQKEHERREKDRLRRESVEKDKERRKIELQKNTELKKDSDSKNEDSNENGLIPTRVEKLSGPTVVGKINLPAGGNAPKRKEDDNRNKRKRKRIHKELVHVDKEERDATKKVSTETKPEEKHKKHLQKKTKRPIKKEVNEEDVQKQIRETLAKLTKVKSKGAKYRREKRDEVSRKLQEEVEKQELEKKILKVTEFITANELANLMDLPINQIISTCLEIGSPVSINTRLDAETISILASEFGFEVEYISVEVQDTILEELDSPEDLSHRPPIVTVMGHVDHGKTSLLDYIRSTNVIAGEAGGITQHIGAYNVLLKDGKRITFLDTPGHEAFTAMRARGAKITDIAIIVVAADDNVMPQTVEAINHAQAANVPIVFAINKIDKPGANPDKIKEELSVMNYLVEEWGGKYQSQDISAKKGLNIELLLEKVLLEAEMLDLKANPNKRAVGSIIESELDKGRGFMATLLVQTGTIRIGDIILAGSTFGKVKAMFNERNQRVTEAGPSEPVVILGLNGAPQAGDKFHVMENERAAKEIAIKREQVQRELGRRAQKHITLDEIGRRIAIGNFKELNIIVKGDVDGSIEALSDALSRLSTAQIQLNIIHKAVGQIAESDVMLAAASNAVIVGFQVRPSIGARKLAEKEGIEIRLYSIIYDAINEIKDAMEGMLSPEIKEEILGTAEIKEVYKISKVGTIAGCIVKDGKIARTAKVRVIRDGIVIYTGNLASLKRFKDDVKEVARGLDCGLNIDRFNDIKVGDYIEAFTEVEVKQTL